MNLDKSDISLITTNYIQDMDQLLYDKKWVVQINPTRTHPNQSNFLLVGTIILLTQTKANVQRSGPKKIIVGLDPSHGPTSTHQACAR